MTPVANGAAEARKRRKEIIQSQRSENELMMTPSSEDREPSDEPTESAEKKPPKKRKVDDSEGDTNGISGDKKKTQIRYDPDVPMDKEQLAAWRREARRVRNRESAAASRQRIRNRINELEDEVGDWKAKYAHAMERLQALQQSIEAETAAKN